MGQKGLLGTFQSARTCGATAGTRTLDFLITSEVLYLLSYGGLAKKYDTPLPPPEARGFGITYGWSLMSLEAFRIASMSLCSSKNSLTLSGDIHINSAISSLG